MLCRSLRSSADRWALTIFAAKWEMDANMYCSPRTSAAACELKRRRSCSNQYFVVETNKHIPSMDGIDFSVKISNTKIYCIRNFRWCQCHIGNERMMCMHASSYEIHEIYKIVCFDEQPKKIRTEFVRVSHSSPIWSQLRRLSRARSITMPKWFLMPYRAYVHKSTRNNMRQTAAFSDAA